MSNRHAVFLTARREVRELLRSRAFRVSTAIQLAIVIAIVVISGLTSGDSTDKFDVGYVGPEAQRVVEAAQKRQASVDAELTVHAYNDEAGARAAVADDDLDVAVVTAGLVARSNPSETLIALLQGASASVRGTEVLERQGVGPDEIQAALEPQPLTVTEVGEPASGSGIAFVGSLLLYIAILSFGFVVATAVVVEKASRVVEVVLSAIRPIQLLTGKVLGVGLLGLVQVLLVTGVGLGISVAIGSIELPSSTAETAILVGLYFVLGYLLYASAFALAGSIVSRQEDLQSSAAPLSIVLVAGYLAGIATIDSPDGGLATVCTFLPPVAPMVVPGRAAQGELPAWELALSIALMLAAIVLLIFVAARVYDRVVLRMGAPMKIREALRLAR
jgi:ABC-2 type transport system permease protein